MTICMKCQSLFLGKKNKKNVINLPPAEFAERELMVKVAVICGLLNQMHHNLFITLLLGSIA